MVSEIALVVTALGVLGAVYGLRQSYRERLRQFEAMYVNRYWSLLDRLSLDALSGADPKAISPSDQKVIRSYLFLCEDELEMRERGYIADSTFHIWAGGICEQLNQPMFRKTWNEVSSEPTFPYEHLTRLLDEGSEYDPCAMPKWRRRLRGLAGISGV